MVLMADGAADERGGIGHSRRILERPDEGSQCRRIASKDFGAHPITVSSEDGRRIRFACFICMLARRRRWRYGMGFCRSSIMK